MYFLNFIISKKDISSTLSEIVLIQIVSFFHVFCVSLVLFYHIPAYLGIKGDPFFKHSIFFQFRFYIQIDIIQFGEYWWTVAKKMCGMTWHLRGNLPQGPCRDHLGRAPKQPWHQPRSQRMSWGWQFHKRIYQGIGHCRHQIQAQPQPCQRNHLYLQIAWLWSISFHQMWIGQPVVKPHTRNCPWGCGQYVHITS